MPKTDYHFTFGDSNDGAVGFCAVVRAESKADAVKTLQDRIADMEDEMAAVSDDGPIQYITFYMNHRNITEQDIDDENEVEAGDDED